MKARASKAGPLDAASSAAVLLEELELPRTTAFEAFEDRLDAQLAELEARFSDFVTRDSLAGSIRRQAAP
jgi:hypothetical protein